jgi:hypothetical protein
LFFGPDPPQADRPKASAAAVIAAVTATDLRVPSVLRSM